MYRKLVILAVCWFAGASVWANDSLPIIGAMFTDLINTAIITLFLNLL